MQYICRYIYKMTATNKSSWYDCDMHTYKYIIFTLQCNIYSECCVFNSSWISFIYLYLYTDGVKTEAKNKRSSKLLFSRLLKRSDIVKKSSVTCSKKMCTTRKYTAKCTTISQQICIFFFLNITSLVYSCKKLLL